MCADSDIVPGGGISRRPLHVFILADCSGSMKADGRMQALNFAIASMLPHLGAWERDQEQAQVFVRVIAFGDTAEWVVSDPVPLRTMRWTPLNFVEKGLTAMGAALRLLAEELQPGRLEDRALRPAILLITDGRPTDPAEFDEGLRILMGTQAGHAAIRLAVAIGRGANSEYLARFIGNPAIPVLVADNAEQITDQLLAASLAMSRMSVVGAKRTDAVGVPVPETPSDETVLPEPADETIL